MDIVMASSTPLKMIIFCCIFSLRLKNDNKAITSIEIKKKKTRSKTFKLGLDGVDSCMNKSFGLGYLLCN